MGKKGEDNRWNMVIAVMLSALGSINLWAIQAIQTNRDDIQALKPEVRRHGEINDLIIKWLIEPKILEQKQSEWKP